VAQAYDECSKLMELGTTACSLTSILLTYACRALGIVPIYFHKQCRGFFQAATGSLVLVNWSHPQHACTYWSKTKSFLTKKTAPQLEFKLKRFSAKLHVWVSERKRLVFIIHQKTMCHHRWLSEGGTQDCWPVMPIAMPCMYAQGSRYNSTMWRHTMGKYILHVGELSM